MGSVLVMMSPAVSQPANGHLECDQRIGPTDENGYFEAMVTLPDRVMVTVWVDAPGFVPSKLMFFHPYSRKTVS